MAHASSKTTTEIRDDAAFPSNLLRNRNFVLLWAAYGISAFGDHLSEMGLLKWQDALNPLVTDTTRRQAVMTFAFMLPFFVLGPICGWLADRLPRRLIMIGADVVRAVIMFEMFVILAGLQGWFTPGYEPTQPIALSTSIIPLALLGIFAATFSPARLALLPTLIRPGQLIRANAFTAGLGMIATIVSFAVGGFLVEHFSVRANFRLDSLTFVASGLCLFFIRPPRGQRVAATAESGLAAIADGFRYVKQHHLVWETIFISFVLWTAASVFRSVIPAIVKDVFGGSYADIGIYQGLLGVGLVCGSVALALIGPALKSPLAISWSLKLAGAAGLFTTCAIAFRWPNWVCGTGIALIGFFGAGIQVSVNALLQRIVPNQLRGRVFGVHDLCTMAGLLFATGLLGIPHWPNIDRHITWIAAAVSIALLATGIWTTLVRLGRGRFGRGITFWKNLSEFMCRLTARAKRVGVCTVPMDGPVIVAANHNSTLDPFLLIAMCPNRLVCFMIAREYYEVPVLKKLFDLSECVPVNRTGFDAASIKASLRHLEAGKVLGIFPQGRVQFPEEPVELREGVGMLALRSGATVIPAYVSGVEQRRFTGGKLNHMVSMVAPFLTPQRAEVRFGKAVDLSPWKGREKDRVAYKEASQAILDAIMAMKPEGVAARQ